MSFRPRNIVAYTLLSFLSKLQRVSGGQLLQSIPDSFLLAIIHISKDPKYLFDKVVTNTQAVNQDAYPAAPLVEVHSIVSTAVLTMYVLMAKSFQLATKLKVNFVVHDDGSLRKEHISFLKKHLPGVRIFTERQALQMFDDQLKNYPMLYSYRHKQHPNKINIISTVDIPQSSKKKFVLYLDGDMLFFNEPTELKAWMLHPTQDQMIYSQDYKNAYILPQTVIKKKFGVEIIKKFNMGILAYPASALNLPKLEKYFTFLHQIKKDDIMLRDQTYWMMLARQIFKGGTKLSDTYVVSFAGKRTKDTICYHYTSEVRLRIYPDGIYLAVHKGLL